MEHDLRTILQAIPMFKLLGAADLDALVKLMAPQSFTRNQAIMVEGHPPPGLYVVLEGKVAVMKGFGEAADHICDLDAGECVGELEIVENAPCSASVVAHGDLKTAVITRDNLEKFFAAHPSAAVLVLRQMVTILSTRLRKANVSYASMKAIADGMAEG
jgi:CRP-like cAMP-binding protein